MPSSDLTERLLARVEALVERADALLPPREPDPDWDNALAFHWRRSGLRSWPQPIAHPHRLRLSDLHGIDRQKRELERNTRQFVEGLPANNALLWGSRGTGKSSLVKALLTEYSPRGLRVVEVDKNDLIDLPAIVDCLIARPERFVLFSDDLSFEANDPSYKALKAVLDGSIQATPDNILLYATSNRRHLLPEYMSENLDAQHVDGEIHQSDAVEEKISLSERFGLWLSFYAFRQDDYLEIAYHWLRTFDVDPDGDEAVRAAALEWALTRGSRSGRSAYQFARDWAGQRGLAG